VETGEFSRRILHTRADITSVDISQDLLAVAKMNVVGSNIKFYIQNAEKTDFEDGCFDTVVGSSILHHLNVRCALREIHRVLKKRGKIIFTEPNMLNPQIWLERNLKTVRKLMNNSEDETAFTRWKLKRELFDAGLRIL
jgi:SAM-dependent methyltransferase